MPLPLEFTIISVLNLFLPLTLPTPKSLQDCIAQAIGWLHCSLDLLGAPDKANSFPCHPVYGLIILLGMDYVASRTQRSLPGYFVVGDARRNNLSFTLEGIF